MIRLRTKDGVDIVGTLERIEGTATVHGFEFTGGVLLPVYAGETEVDWNSQRPIHHDGKMILIDDLGRDWLADLDNFEIVEVPDD